MYKNFLTVASANIKTKLLNVENNRDEIKKYLQFAFEKKIDIVLFPELTLTGVSGGEMIASREITSRAKAALVDIINLTKDYQTLVIIGLPIRVHNKVLNALVGIKEGEIEIMRIKNDLSYEESKYFDTIDDELIFAPGLNEDPDYQFVSYNHDVFSINEYSPTVSILFENELNDLSNLNHGINLIAGGNPTNANELNDLEIMLKSISRKNNNAIVYAGASNFESSSNYIYSAQKYIFENDVELEKSDRFSNGLIYTQINLDEVQIKDKKYEIDNVIYFAENEIDFRREINAYPYLPTKENWDTFMHNILDIQSEAIARRLHQIPDKKIFLGLSGGLDSTLALISSKLAFDKLGLDYKDLHAITMPGLGTSDRTKNNALELAKSFGVDIQEISIKESVLQHFKDINHDENDFSTTYENAQARERTQVLMDLSNKHGGIVLGTGNMSEIALGWATYNGDHISMYSANAGLPKTLLREVVRYYKNHTDDETIKNTLADIIDTPISPELLPTNEEGEINQKTEDNVGPYELHDFFIYHLVRNKSKISDIYFMAKLAFKNKYSQEEIQQWFKKLLSRFVSQQFKRNVAVDSPLLLDYSLNPKFGFTMPSDVDVNALLFDDNFVE